MKRICVECGRESADEELYREFSGGTIQLSQCVSLQNNMRGQLDSLVSSPGPLSWIPRQVCGVWRSHSSVGRPDAARSVISPPHIQPQHFRLSQSIDIRPSSLQNGHGHHWPNLINTFPDSFQWDFLSNCVTVAILTLISTVIVSLLNCEDT